MAIRSAERWRVRAAAVAAVLVCLLQAGAAGAQTAAEAPAASAAAASVAVPTARLETARSALDEIEAALNREGLSARVLAHLRSILNDTRERLRGVVEEVEPRFAEIDTRLKQLGPAPTRGASEHPTVAAEREQLTRAHRQLDAAVKQARLLTVRAEQLHDRLTQRRHGLYAQELFERSPSLFDPQGWSAAADAFAAEWRAITAALPRFSDVNAAAALRGAVALALLALIAAAAIGVTRLGLPRLDAAPRSDTRFARARTGLFVFLWLALRTPLAIVVGALALEAMGLLPPRLGQIAAGLVAGTLVAAFGRGAARGLLAPDKPQRRLLRIGDGEALAFHDYLVWSTRLFGAMLFLQTIHKAFAAPLAAAIATHALFGLLLVALLVWLVRRLRQLDGLEAAQPGEASPRARWARPLAWAVVAAILAFASAGYIGFAAFIAVRTVVASAVFAALYLLLVIADAIFTDALDETSPRARALAGHLGVSVRNVGVVGALISAAARVLLVVLALVLVIGPWEVSTADLFESLQSLPLAFQLGELTVSFRGLVAGVVAFVLVLLITRVAQRWMQTQLLPRTAIEPSLQLSIATIFGYVGAIAAVMVALSALGVDLQKIALVAGALSVGIGFGLQSIVSNFVSGLILLAERPIRVGDSVVVKGEEGWVRRIRVRATEIETFDRASVIIPNSELITGVVKNWTHANTMGRVVIKLEVSNDADPEEVRGILDAIAQEHPHILAVPQPRAFFTVFGENGLGFELRCVVDNVDQGLAVKSDLHFAILKRFKEAGIKLSSPQRDVTIHRADSPL